MVAAIPPVISDHPAATCLDPAALMAAELYAAIQPFVVDKRPFFEAMMRMVEAGGDAGDLSAGAVAAEDGVGGGDSGAPDAEGKLPAGLGRARRVVELGVGTGGFLEWVARCGAWPEAVLIGCDRSAEALAVARVRLARHDREAVLCAGVEALAAGDPFYARFAAPGTADVVVLSQFEHYAPNDAGSPLGSRLAGGGRALLTKGGLRRLAAECVRPGGWVFVIDDYAAATAEEQAAWDRAWDERVVGEFAGTAVGEAVGAVDPDWAAKFGHRYGAGRPWDRRLALVRRARARRRCRHGEEVQPLAAAWGDFRAVFGAAAARIMPHPDRVGHPQFYLFAGRRSDG